MGSLPSFLGQTISPRSFAVFIPSGPLLSLCNIANPSKLRHHPVQSTRVPKDPSAYNSIEDLRRELEESQNRAPFSISRTIQWLSDAANNGGGGLAFMAYKWALQLDQPPQWRRPKDIDGDRLVRIEEETDPDTLHQIQTLLLIPRSAAVKLLYKVKNPAAVSVGDLMRRLIDLKQLCPGSNVARMIELVPSAFLTGPWEPVYEHIKITSSILRDGLPGANVDAIFDEDPTILFEDPESLHVGIERLKELWPTANASTLSNSEPEELALAVRALGLRGPPKSV